MNEINSASKQKEKIKHDFSNKYRSCSGFINTVSVVFLHSIAGAY